MKKQIARILSFVLLMTVILSGCNGGKLGSDLGLGNKQSTGSVTESPIIDVSEHATVDEITEDGEYSSKEEVAKYLMAYNHLPSNYITKSEATALGWESNKGNLWDVAYGKSIGGDRFGNREGKLPEAEGRKWYECDINYEGGYRGSERLVYSSDGLIYYTEDHYETFSQMN